MAKSGKYVPDELQSIWPDVPESHHRHGAKVRQTLNSSGFARNVQPDEMSQFKKVDAFTFLELK